jgi:hypothetical protein
MSDEEFTGDELSARREQVGLLSKMPAATDGTTYCPKCNSITRPFYRNCPKCEGERNRMKVDDLATVIRELKATIESPISADQEATLVRQLHSMQHPDVSGFMSWLEEARKAGKKPTTKKGWQR